MNREIHVRICESLRGQFPRATRPRAAIVIDNLHVACRRVRSWPWAMAR